MKSRFCPSPSGQMHLGNARTALFNALLAKGSGGTFLLRIEDTDQARSSVIHTQQLLDDLRWLGLSWQEGPEINGEHGPYWQSQRQTIYADYYQQLIDQELAYPCFCTEQQLALVRKIQLSSGQPPRYAGTCRHLTTTAKTEKQAQGILPSLRFTVPADQIVEFNDVVFGWQRFNTNDLGDFIIRRADGTASFLYSNAIDDATMQVTHALRGSDHLTNTPRQLLLLQALGLPAPIYGHLSLILGSDHTPLSKRHGSRSIHELADAGYLAAAIVNYLARLGHHYKNSHYMTLTELATAFSTEALGTAPAHFDSSQLQFWQKEAVMQLDSATFWNWLGSPVQSLVPEEQRDLFIDTIRCNISFPSEAEQWARLLFNESLVLTDLAKSILAGAGEKFFLIALAVLSEHGLNIKAITQTLQAQIGLKGKALYQPLRLALTGVMHGPELDRVVLLLGLKKVQERLQAAATHCLTH